MNKTKKYIELLERITNKKVILEEITSESKILFLHGLDSNPEKEIDKTNFIKNLGFEINVPHIEYEKKDSVEIISFMIEELKITHIIGHSLGGCIAFNMSNKYKIPSLLFNPAFESDNLLHLEDYKNISLFKDQIAVVGMQDSDVDPNIQLKNLKGIDNIFKLEIDHDIPQDIFEEYFKLFSKGDDKNLLTLI